MKALALVLAVIAGQTTLDQRIVPAQEGAPYSGLTTGPGDPYVVREDLAKAGAQRTRARRSLTYFAQLSDFQIADEESPMRVEMLDATNSVFSSAWRPQEALMPWVVDASVRQVGTQVRSPVRQGDGSRARLGHAILTGDLADNQQLNETRWVAALLDGGTVDPNSGNVTDEAMGGLGCALADRAALEAEAPRYTGVQDFDDIAETGGVFYDPETPAGRFAAFPAYPGLMDRAQLPFQATGLPVPSYVAMGNHDALIQGNQAAIAPLNSLAMGCLKPTTPALDAGAVDGLLQPTLPGTAPQNAVLVPPDRDRTQITKGEYRTQFKAGQSDAHGFAYVDPEEERASAGAASYYSFSPAPRVRFIALDTVATGGVVGIGAEGNLDDPQYQWLKRTLDAAQAADELVIVFSHHGPTSLTADLPDEVAGSCDDPLKPSNPGCDQDPRSSQPIRLGGDVRGLLLARPNVVAWIAGHSHVNDVAAETRPDGTGMWVVRTSAEADHPQQSRLLDLMDNRDGTLSLFGTLIDTAAPAEAPAPGTNAAGMSGDELASLARTLGYNDPDADRAAGGDPEDRNVELMIADPRRDRRVLPGGSKRLKVSVRPRRIRAGRRVTLTVRATRGGKPVKGVKVRLGARKTKTRANGRARLRVRFSKPGTRTLRAGRTRTPIVVVRR